MQLHPPADRHVDMRHIKTHWGRVIYICFIELGPHLFMQWPGASSAPSHYRPNDLLLIGSLSTNWMKLRSEFKYFLWKIYIENGVCKMAAILRWPQCVKHFCQQSYSSVSVVHVHWYLSHFFSASMCESAMFLVMAWSRPCPRGHPVIHWLHVVHKLMFTKSIS